MSAAPVLRATELGKRYGRRQALTDVSFDVRPGERLAVIGPNGAGKTTLLSILAGVQAASAGTVTLAQRSVGWVPQQPALYTKLSVAENLRLFARLERLQTPAAAVREMLAQTGLAERAAEQVGRLSTGNRQRVNIAIGLLGRPRVLLLDEPSATLDPLQRERLWAFLATLADGGASIVFSTHELSEAEQRAGRVIVLGDGRVLFDGLPRDLAGARRAPGAGPRGAFEAAFLDLLCRRGG